MDDLPQGRKNKDSHACHDMVSGGYFRMLCRGGHAGGGQGCRVARAGQDGGSGVVLDFLEQSAEMSEGGDVHGRSGSRGGRDRHRVGGIFPSVFAALFISRKSVGGHLPVF